MADLSVGIIGGGIAGICSAVALKESGFDVAFFNSSDTGVSKTFDFIAKGF